VSKEPRKFYVTVVVEAESLEEATKLGVEGRGEFCAACTEDSWREMLAAKEAFGRVHKKVAELSKVRRTIQQLRDREEELGREVLDTLIELFGEEVRWEG